MNKDEIYDIVEIKRRLAPVFQVNGVKSAVLFGSYATGEATAHSDVDILVDSGLRGLDFVGLIEHAQEALQKDVDLIEAHYLKRNSRIEQEINKTGVYIYGG
ncbi:MAG: nucleotidyltransferase domain-containing protein [Candidatus Adiutrix sp.]|jgi:predicted nucleotidyltransferase|nr:nucleotidyltransferase domain-containing protein [Candidatus Adiutrix sp.]